MAQPQAPRFRRTAIQHPLKHFRAARESPSAGFICFGGSPKASVFRFLTVGLVTVAHPARDIPIRTLTSIEKQSGLKLR
jgi:hypothetical protein